MQNNVTDQQNVNTARRVSRQWRKERADMATQMERTARGLVFEAVYSGVHDIAACAVEQCPCKELAQPYDDARDEEVAVIFQVERNLTIEQARAVLKDW